MQTSQLSFNGSGIYAGLHRPTAYATVNRQPHFTALHAFVCTAGSLRLSSPSNRQTRQVCCCQKGTKDSQPKLTRQSVQEALGDAVVHERGYLLKLFSVSAAGAAVVKFGSLAISTPFEPSGIIALSIITIPCLAYSVLLLRWQDK